MDDAIGILLALIVASGYLLFGLAAAAIIIVVSALVVVAWLGSCLIMFLHWLWYHLPFAADAPGRAGGL